MYRKVALTTFQMQMSLTIKDYFKTFYDSILTALNQMLPLKQLIRIDAQSSNFPL